ncbi:uncharacterized protein PAC_19559 [Phialocephala subalpina]|uniref:Uncharacterized protein n=1 Tax=Phialocephala subalpina TaxID=576137 RepID=A0A1L7XXE1_9HELO|nr:uncharacterized protein PAC_19559 [Phialocephala subalpina]
MAPKPSPPKTEADSNMNTVPVEESHEPQYRDPSPEVEAQLHSTTASPDTQIQDQPPAYAPPLPERKPVPPRPNTASSTTSSTKQDGGKGKEKLKEMAGKAKEAGKFWLDHVKRGEMPWTQWYCCGVVDGKECETENHRMRKECKKCKHRVCGNCVKGTL